jgi:hypothetical protein
MTIKEFATNATVQRSFMMGAGIALGMSGALVPALVTAQQFLYPAATALFFWALRGPGHVTATD